MENRTRRFLPQLLTALGLLLIPALGHSTTYYASTTGSDNNTCPQAQNSSTPKRTINAALNCLGTAAGAGASHTVQVAPGTYTETINNTLPGGTSWSAPFTLKATTVGTVTIKPPVGTDSCLVIARSSSKYALISGFVCDAVNVTYDGIKLTDGSSGTASFIRVQDVEIKNATRQGILVTRSTDNQFIRITSHDNGTVDNLDHGIYLGEAAHRTLIEDSLFYNNHAYGIQLYHSSTPPNGCLVRNNRSFTNGTGGLVIWATNSTVYNNLVYNNHTAAGNLLGNARSGIKVGSNANGVKVYNNTVYGHKGNSSDMGIEVSSGAVNTEVKNNIAYNNAQGISNSGTSTTLAANLTTDPKFVNAAAANFALQAGSPAINVGMTLSAVLDDYVGVARPQGPAYDIGGHEFVSGSAAFNFSLTNGGSQSVTRGASAINTITAALLSGTARAVSFSTSGLPTGATAAFSPMTCSPGCSTSLALRTTTSTPTGTYTVTVRGIGGGVTRTTSFSLTVTAPSATTTTTRSFQDGLFPTPSYSGTRDTRLAKSSPSTNYGTAATLLVQGNNGSPALLRWKGLTIPAGSIVKSVTITLNVTNPTSGTYNLYAAKRDWWENESNWNSYGPGSNWQIPGAKGTADRGTTVLGTVTASSTGKRTITLNAAGIALVQAWINSPITNNGIIIDNPTVTDAMGFDSKEASTASNHPKLTVTYVAP